MGIRDQHTSRPGSTPVLSRQEEIDLSVRARAGDRGARNRLITSNLPLVVKIANEYHRATRMPLDELVQEGSVGLVLGVDRYDPSRGVKLCSYAGWWIRALILRYLMANFRIVRIGKNQTDRKMFYALGRRLAEAAEATDPYQTVASGMGTERARVEAMAVRMGPRAETSIHQIHPMHERPYIDILPDDGSNPEQDVGDLEWQATFRKEVEAFMAQCTKRDREIFHRRFSKRRETLERIGRSLGITRERTRQIEAKITLRLRRHLEQRGLEAA